LPVTAIMTPREDRVFLNIDDTEKSTGRKIVPAAPRIFRSIRTPRQVLGMVG